MEEYSNEDNIRGLRKRDPEVYEVVFKKYYPSLFAFVNRHVGDQDVSKDIVQEVFLKLFESCCSLPENFNLKSWLYRIARNESLDYLRHLQVIDRHKFLLADAMIMAGEVDEVIDEEAYDRVNQAIDNLPEQCRLIVKLHIIEGKKYLEISEKLNISINTVRTQISRGYKKLRESLSHERDILFLIIYMNRL